MCLHSVKAGAIKRTPVKSKRKQVNRRQDGIFKRFTVLVVDFFKEKFIWAKKKPVVVPADTEHDRCITENYVFDEVQGIYVQRAEFERRARFNADDYKPTKDESARFPRRSQTIKPDSDQLIDLTPPMHHTKMNSVPRWRPVGK